MTMEELLGLSADDLEKFTKEQLLEWAAPFLKVTRPDPLRKTTAADPSTETKQLSEKKQKELWRKETYKKAQDIASKFGIDLGVK